MLLLALVLGVAAGVLRGGDVRSLGHLRLRGWLLYLLAFVAQVAIQRVTYLVNPQVQSVVYVASFGLLLVGCWMDRHQRGIPWVISGLVMNGAVVLLNDGKMPVLTDQATIQKGGSQALTHVSMVRSTHIWFLGDVIRLPLLSGHFILVSPGDALIAVGVLAAILHVMNVGRSEGAA